MKYFIRMDIAGFVRHLGSEEEGKGLPEIKSKSNILRIAIVAEDHRYIYFHFKDFDLEEAFNAKEQDTISFNVNGFSKKDYDDYVLRESYFGKERIENMVKDGLSKYDADNRLFDFFTRDGDISAKDVKLFFYDGLEFIQLLDIGLKMRMFNGDNVMAFRWAGRTTLPWEGVQSTKEFHMPETLEGARLLMKRYKQVSHFIEDEKFTLKELSKK